MKIENAITLISKLKLHGNPEHDIEEFTYYLLHSALEFSRIYPEIFNEETTLEGCKNILVKNLESIENNGKDILKDIYNNEKNINMFTSTYDTYITKVCIFLSNFDSFDITLPYIYAIEKMEIWLKIANNE